MAYESGEHVKEKSQNWSLQIESLEDRRTPSSMNPIAAGHSGEETSESPDDCAHEISHAAADIAKPGSQSFVIDWILVDAQCDGFLFRTGEVNSDEQLYGNPLVNDEIVPYFEGYETLALFETDCDGMISATEASELGLWFDDEETALDNGQSVSPDDSGNGEKIT